MGFASPKKIISQTEYLVGYIDLLGTGQKIQEDRSSQYINKIREIYNETLDFCNKFEKHFTGFSTIKTKIFSDNILIYLKCGKIIDNLGLLVAICGVFQAEAYKKGILTRGGISKGNFYSDNLFVYGEALLNSVKLEEKIAIYPRVIIDKGLNDSCKEAEQNKLNKESKVLLKDMDAFYYINFYNFLALHNPIEESEAAGLKSKLEELKNTYRNNLSIMQKIDWLINYHNNYLKKLSKNSSYLKKYLI